MSDDDDPELIAIAEALPSNATYTINLVKASDDRPAHYIANVADSNGNGDAGYGETKAEALREAVYNYLSIDRKE